MRTRKDYIEKLSTMKHNVYMWGEKLEKPWDHPQIKPGINAVATTFDFAHDPKYEDLMTTISPLTGEKINRWTHLYQSHDDMLKRVDALRAMCQVTGSCVGRCVGTDGLHAIGIVTYEADQKLGTTYHQRFLNYVKYFQKNDLVAAGAVTDVKGDRDLRPHQQADPDLYLRVVEKRKDGIVVNGAKNHITIAAYADELIIVPTRALTKEESDWAVAFAIPADTEGITHIAVSKAPRAKKKFEAPVSSNYAFTDSFLIFDHVFVPWERVFICGEWQFAAQLGALFGHYHRHSHCGCIPARVDTIMGATSLIAKYNGISKKAHVRNKLCDLAMVAELVYACGYTASMKGTKHASGLYQPNYIYSNIGKFHSGTHVAHEMEIAQDIAGGLIITMPSEEDYFNPKTQGYLKKYLRGPAEVPVEDRIRAFRLVEDLAASRYGALWMVAGVIGAGAPEAQRVAIMSNYNFEEKEKIAKKLANIEL
jgi:aromatic ring hydroxylase